jgi:hypothetical protein
VATPSPLAPLAEYFEGVDLQELFEEHRREEREIEDRKVRDGLR